MIKIEAPLRKISVKTHFLGKTVRTRGLKKLRRYGKSVQRREWRDIGRKFALKLLK